MELTFADLPAFVARWKKLRLDDEDLQALERQLMQAPAVGSVMKGTGGVRKVRFAPPSWNKGKSGAARVRHFTLVDVECCYLMAIYAKNEKENLSAAERAELRKLVKAIKSS